MNNENLICSIYLEVVLKSVTWKLYLKKRDIKFIFCIIIVPLYIEKNNIYFFKYTPTSVAVYSREGQRDLGNLVLGHSVLSKTLPFLIFHQRHCGFQRRTSKKDTSSVNHIWISKLINIYFSLAWLSI